MSRIDSSSHASRYPPSFFALLFGLVAQYAEAQVIYAAGGADHTCAVTLVDSVKCWGKNTDGQLGNGAFSNSLVPTTVIGLNAPVQALAAGEVHTCALTSAGAVKCWGNNSQGQLGNNSLVASNRPVDVVGLSSGVSGIAAGTSFTCALHNTNGVKCWGSNNNLQLGVDSSITGSLVPVQVQALPFAVNQIAVGSVHACALTATGSIKCWGSNSDCQLGNGSSCSFSATSIPADVVGASSGMSKLSAGLFHSCAINVSGAAKCWGANRTGQIGNGTRDSNSSAVGVFGLTSGVAGVAAGRSHTCAVLVSGEVKCWGAVYGDSEIATAPRSVPSLDRGIRFLAAGYNHTCAVNFDGDIRCWGFNSYGVVGDGTDNNFRTIPVAVIGLSSSVPNGKTMTMVEHRYVALDYYFMTSRDADKTALDSLTNWQRTGKSFSVLANYEIGSSPITRFYFDQIAQNKSRGSHFYTLLSDEVAALQSLNPTNQPAPGKPVNEGIDSYAYLPNMSGACASGQVPVYRLFRGNARFPDDPNHRFTTDLTIYNEFVALGWDGEGVKLCVPQ